MKRSFLAALLAVPMAVGAVATEAVKPIDALQGPMETVIAILKDPRYKPASEKAAQREKLWEIIDRVFDFDGISEKAVGRNWKRFSPDQKKAFNEAFAHLLGDNYLAKIQGNYTNEKVEFLSQEMLGDAKARVKTKIIREVDAVPVDYSVHPVDGAWRIYDVNIEGVSLVQNYRSQFDQILSKDSPDTLIERVKSKNKAQEKEREKK